MTKSNRKYNPKVTFDGTFEDLLGMTFNAPKCKFKIGDIVVKGNQNYIIIGSKQAETMPHGSDYAIHPENDKSTIVFVKEAEIHIAD